MKKFIILISILMLCIIAPAGASAEATFSIDNVSAKIGDTVTVNVSLSGNTDIAGGGFEIKYNPDILEVSGGTVSSAVLGFVNTAYAVDKVKVGVASFSPLPSEMIFCTITFVAKAEGECSLEFGNTDMNNVSGKPVGASFENGAVSVSGEEKLIYGDVNSDGSVDIMDAQRLYMYIVGSVSDLAEQELLAADVYKDGSITVRDAQKLAQYLANFSGIVLGE